MDIYNECEIYMCGVEYKRVIKIVLFRYSYSRAVKATVGSYFHHFMVGRVVQTTILKCVFKWDARHIDSIKDFDRNGEWS